MEKRQINRDLMPMASEGKTLRINDVGFRLILAPAFGIVIPLVTGMINLKVILRHALDKSLPDAQNWNSTTYEKAGGEDDLNIAFALKAE